MGGGADYEKFTGPARIEKAINTLAGLIQGVTADRELHSSELSYLRQWVLDHDDIRNREPLRDVLETFAHALHDGVITAEEQADILWLCRRVERGDFFNQVTHDFQHLHGMLAGIASDFRILEEELKAVDQWLSEHDELRGLWPYDEVESLVTAAMADGKIDEAEHRELLMHFAQYSARGDDRTIDLPAEFSSPIGGLCALTPDITFRDRRFCLTGRSSRFDRTRFSEVILGAGGSVDANPTRKTHYVVVGADGNRAWAYACYGRKIEAAMELRRSGIPVILVHENDLHDALADL